MYYNELHQAVKLRFGTSNATQSMGDWICANTTIKKRPFSWDGYWFQEAIASDMHPNLAVKKCSQIGLTEVQIRKFLAMLTRSTSLAGIFSMPNEKMFTKTYNGRIKPILEQDDVFNPPVLSGTKPTRSKDQIQIRDSFGYITACTEGDATSISADFLFHDELDLSPQEIIALYQSRLQGSDLQVTQAFSTPTFVNYGIDKRFKMGDQREYIVRCSNCNHYQIPRFEPKFIHIEDYPFDVESFTDLTSEQISLLNLENCYVRCEHCSSRLDLGQAGRREWIATFPSRTNFRSYQVRPFSTPRLKPAYVFTQLAKYQEDNFIRGFHNTVLGEEYTAKDAQIQKEDILACMARGTPSIPNVSSDTPCFLGVDVGMICHITISHDDADGFPVFDLFETCPQAHLESRLAELAKIYTLVQGAVDRFPYTPMANALRDVTHGLIVPIQYRGSAALQPVFEPDTKDLSHYSASRTFILDRLHSLISHKQMILSGYQGQKDTLLGHLTDMVRDERPDVEAEWKKTTGQDHYFHAMALNLLSRRVCEHMYATQTSTMAITSSFLTGGFATAQGGADLLGGSHTKSLARMSRLG